MALADMADQWRSKGTAYLTAQVDSQLAALARRVSASGDTLHAVAKQLNDDPNLAMLAPFVVQGATRVEALTSSFSGRDASQLWHDARRLAYKRPWLATATASAVGFVISRAVKASAKQDLDGTPFSSSIEATDRTAMDDGSMATGRHPFS